MGPLNLSIFSFTFIISFFNQQVITIYLMPLLVTICTLPRFLTYLRQYMLMTYVKEKGHKNFDIFEGSLSKGVIQINTTSIVNHYDSN